jgi:hypothetical protein
LIPLPKGFSISIRKGFSLGFPCQGIFYFQFAMGFLIFILHGYEYKVDDLQGVKGFTLDLTGFNCVKGFAKGFSISTCKGFSLGFPCHGIFDFQLAR